MRTLDEAVDRFAYHPATSATAEQHAALRDLFIDFLPKVWDLLPEGPDRTLVVRDLERALQMGNAAIAMQAPADMSKTRSVARVLPEEDPQEPKRIGLVEISVGVEFGHRYRIQVDGDIPDTRVHLGGHIGDTVLSRQKDFIWHPSRGSSGDARLLLSGPETHRDTPVRVVVTDLTDDSAVDTRLRGCGCGKCMVTGG